MWFIQSSQTSRASQQNRDFSFMKGVDMRKVDGIVEDGFETIRDAFAEAQLQDEGGAQLCIYRHGKRVVDLWTGRDKVNDRPNAARTSKRHETHLWAL